MAKIDSTTSSGVTGTTPDEESPVLSLAETAVKSTSNAFGDPASLSTFTAEDGYSALEGAYQWATHSDEDVSQVARDLAQNPKQTLSKMGDSETKWMLGAMTPDDQKSVLDAFVRAGVTRRVSEQAPAGAPKPPALYEVNDTQPAAVKEFLHDKNVRAARDYSVTFDVYAERNADDPKLPGKAMLREPGTGAAVYEPMTLKNANGIGDYFVGKTDDLKQATAVSSQLAALGVGDELKMSFGLDASLKPGGAGLSVDMKAKRSADGYTLAPSATASGSMKLDDDFKAAIGVSGGVEFHADTLKDAQKISGLMEKVVTVGVSSDEKQFLKDHVSGYDLKGSVAAKFFPKQETEGVSNFYTGNGKEELSAHLDVRHHTVTVTTKAQLDGGSALAIKENLPLKKFGMEDMKVAASESRGLSASVSLETKYQFGDQVKDADGALSAMKNGDATTETSMKVRLEKTGKSGVAAEVSVTGQKNVESALGSMRGGLQGFTAELMRNPGTQSKLDVTTSEGASGDLKLGVGSNSIKLAATQVRTHHKTHDAKFNEVLKALVDD